MRKLTNKQKRFCEEYVIDWNASRAALVAGYSKKTAGEQGYQLLQKTSIKKHIEKIKNDLERLSGVSALRNVLELKKMAYTNMAELKNGWMTLKDFNELTNDQKAAIAQVKHTQLRGNDYEKDIVEIKLHDKQKSIESLNKMLGYNAPDKLNQSGEIKITVEEKLVPKRK